MARTVEQILRDTVSNCIALEAQMMSQNEILVDKNNELTAENERLKKELEDVNERIDNLCLNPTIAGNDFSPIKSEDMDEITGLVKADS